MPTRAIHLDRRRLDATGSREEWLLTSADGGFAMGTPIGLNTRRYHALLTVSGAPPVRRTLMLASIDDALRIGGECHRLTPFRFAGQQAPPAPPSLAGFTHEGSSVTWTYEIPSPAGAIRLTKRLVLHSRAREADPAAPGACSIIYTVTCSERLDRHSITLELRPLLRMLDMHELRTRSRGDGPIAHPGASHAIRCETPDDAAEPLELLCPLARFEPDSQPLWYHDLDYEAERARGQSHTEDLFSPGRFCWAIPPGGGEVELLARVPSNARHLSGAAAARAIDTRRERIATDAIASIRPDERDRIALDALLRAADQFVVSRAQPGGVVGASVIAGYPWFSDWGRDTMIALPGLLLTTGRRDEALRILETFAGARRNGLIPNRFADQTGEAEYNTADASLWFLHAVGETARATGADLYRGPLGEACLDIICHHLEGTDYDIGVDPRDGLLHAGSASTQLTWMDAQRDGVTFTPRHGKPVELNALWIHALRVTSAGVREIDPARADQLLDAAGVATASFNASFTNPEGGLFDRLQPGPDGRWTPCAELRPNQIFAASLRCSPLDRDARARVVAACKAHLLTPMGLRTLAPGDPSYHPRYEGSMFQRDAAYHNGTVWPWLIGPYAEAVLRAGDFDERSKSDARAAIEPLLQCCLDGPCIGQIPEVFDADDSPSLPRRWSGCPAQAWSVSELLRILAMLASP